MTNGVSVFSSSPVLAGGANVLTWAIGLYTIVKGVIWLWRAARGTIRSTVSETWKRTVSRIAFHLTLAAEDIHYLVAFCVTHSIRMTLSFVGLLAAFTGFQAARAYPSMPKVVQEIIQPTSFGIAFDGKVMLAFTIFFGCDVSLRIMMLSATAARVRLVRGRRFRSARKLDPSTPRR